MTCWASFTDWRRPARFLSPHGSVREALVVLRHHGGPHRSAREDGFLEELRGGLGHVGPGSIDLPYLELAPSRRVPHRHDPALPFFFFQAEDGIRDGHVTGVQTCALPI